MRYQFKVTEVNHGTIEIGAESLEAAREEVAEAYFQGHVVWGDADLTIEYEKEWEDN
jgi:hypothetical protein